MKIKAVRVISNIQLIKQQHKINSNQSYPCKTYLQINLHAGSVRTRPPAAHYWWWCCCSTSTPPTLTDRPHWCSNYITATAMWSNKTSASSANRTRTVTALLDINLPEEEARSTTTNSVDAVLWNLSSTIIWANSHMQGCMGQPSVNMKGKYHWSGPNVTLHLMMAIF